MIIRNLAMKSNRDGRICSASVAWEDHDFPEQVLFFAIEEDDDEDRPDTVEEPAAEAFLAACFPLAAVHGEARVRVEARPCPMLVEGLLTAHAWWSSWGGMPAAAPRIEPVGDRRPPLPAETPRAVAFLSGGVDGLHMLMRNRRLYARDDPAYIREVVFIHGFDIGKRARDPEILRYRAAARRLEPIAAEVGVKIVRCHTNLRHLPTKPGFWTYRHNGAALAAVGHAAIVGAAYLFIGGTFDVANPVPMGSHPAVDGLFSSQRIRIVHDGSRFSRLAKVCELAQWQTALAALRVCSANVGNRVNCGACEKCLRTRLELLAAGVEETPALGSSLVPLEVLEAADTVMSADHAILYEELLRALRPRGFAEVCRVIEDKLRPYRDYRR
jgi:hypothetical protein